MDAQVVMPVAIELDVKLPAVAQEIEAAGVIVIGGKVWNPRNRPVRPTLRRRG